MSMACISPKSPKELHKCVCCRHCCIHSCRSFYSNNHYVKYADDTALVGLLSNDETNCRSDVDHFMSWCMTNCVELHVIETKETITDFRSGGYHFNPINISGQKR